MSQTTSRKGRRIRMRWLIPTSIMMLAGVSVLILATPLVPIGFSDVRSFLKNNSLLPGGPDVLVGRNSDEEERISIADIDHEQWEGLVARFVDDEGRVDYEQWHATPDARQDLNEYLETLSLADLERDASDESKFAYWINAYNAVTIYGILREYPTDSIRDHTSRFGGYNIWEDLKLMVDGENYSLDQIEHEILRPMKDPRIHFAIVCASHSCPRLLNQAYTADQLETQLETNARHFFSNEENYRYDPDENRFYLSSILNWFGEDFGANRKARLQTIAPWLPDDAGRQAATQGDSRIRYLDYDWSLNSQ